MWNFTHSRLAPDHKTKCQPSHDGCLYAEKSPSRRRIARTGLFKQQGNLHSHRPNQGPKEWRRYWGMENCEACIGDSGTPGGKRSSWSICAQSCSTCSWVCSDVEELCQGNRHMSQFWVCTSGLIFVWTGLGDPWRLSTQHCGHTCAAIIARPGWPQNSFLVTTS